MKIISGSKIPAKIPFMENPPVEGSEIKYLTPEEFQQKFDCEYFEGVQVNDKEHEPINPAILQTSLEKAVYDRLENPLDNLVICKMDSEVGYGLFTLEDIKLGTVLCLYSGEYKLGNNESEYSLSQIDATKIGGIARFMQHLPLLPYTYANFFCQSTLNPGLYSILNNLEEVDALKRLEDKKYIKSQLAENVFYNVDYHPELFDSEYIANLEDDVKKMVADSNVSYKAVIVNNVELIVMIAMRDIKKHEIIGFSYGKGYWKNHPAHQQPILFDKQGKIITKTLEKSEAPIPRSFNLKEMSTQQLKNLSAKLKEMEDNYDSDDSGYLGYGNDDSDDSDYSGYDSSDSNEQDLASAHRNSDAQLHKLIKQMEQLQPAINPISSSHNNNSSQKNSSHNQHAFFSPHDEETIARGIFIREEVKRYKEADNLKTLQAKNMQNTSKLSFNQERAIEHINTALGATFIKNYITTGKGSWQVEKTIIGDVTLILQGLQIAKKSDCEWYKAKLIKGGIKESNIHFDECKSANDKTTKYKIRLTCVQNIEIKYNSNNNNNNNSKMSRP